MRKISLFLAIMMVALFALGAVAMAEVQLGQAVYAAHGTSAFAVTTVAMEDGKIIAAYINEFQFSNPETFTGVPNTEKFTNADGNVLQAKRFNDEAYSANMIERAQATQSLVTSYKAIEAFVVGKTQAELEELVADKTSEEMVDAVAGSTLADNLGYLQSIIEACKNVGQ